MGQNRAKQGCVRAASVDQAESRGLLNDASNDTQEQGLVLPDKCHKPQHRASVPDLQTFQTLIRIWKSFAIAGCRYPGWRWPAFGLIAANTTGHVHIKKIRLSAICRTSSRGRGQIRNSRARCGGQMPRQASLP
jgi:hypothetical protein